MKLIWGRFLQKSITKVGRLLVLIVAEINRIPYLINKKNSKNLTLKYLVTENYFGVPYCNTAHWRITIAAAVVFFDFH